uniref:Uncharacterized protein C6G9.01c n=1 Tax=Noccaea caerulescens TaxID=107243 RepID=A0A1J3HEA9_NOCCA
MPKKKSISSLKKPSSKAKRHKPAKEETKPVPKRRKFGAEIDDIFGVRKKKRGVENPEKKETRMKRTKIARKRKELDGFNNNSQNRPRKRTEDGLPLFTEDELGINKANAGGTRRCPFKCLCCL